MQRVRSTCFKELEKLLDYIDSMLNGLSEKYAPKQKTQDNLLKIKSQLKNLFELMLASGLIKSEEQEEEGDKVMLTKRPLNYCASCERDIRNLSPHAGHHLSWKKLPFRDPHDRLAKAGQGFSKILMSYRGAP